MPIELIARAILRRGNHILLCRNVASGYDFLPGGHIEFGEPAAAALARELQEEAGLAITVGPLLLVTEGRFADASGRDHHELNLVFHVEHPGRPAGSSAPPDAADLDEIQSREPEIAFEWVDLAALVDRDLRPLSIKAWLLTQADDPGPGADWISGFDA